MRLAVPSAALPHAYENRHGNRRSHGNKNARNHCRASQERTLPDSPATIEKRLANCWMNVSGKPGSATPPCGIGWRNVQTGIPGKLRRQEIYSPLAVFPIVQIHGNPEPQAENAPALPLVVQVLVFIFPGSLLRSFMPRTGLGSFSCRSRISITFSPFSGMGPEHTALTEVPHSNSAPR